MEIDVGSLDAKKTMERLLSKTVKNDNCCIEFVGCLSRGYGFIGHKGKNYRAHRFSYMYNNDIKKLNRNEYVCHKCDNPSCVNPNHLFLGSQSDNMKDCLSKGRWNNGAREKTHCQRGHKFDDKNTYIRKNGNRECRACARTNRDRYNKKVKERLTNEQ